MMDLPEKIRAFIAVRIPDDIQSELCRLGAQFRSEIRRASWVREGNIHLTLKFLGDIERSMIDQISRELKSIAEKTRRFEMAIDHLGVFPNPRRPRVLWVGVNDGRDQLSELAAQVDDALAGLGFPKEERAFRPHLTLARIKASHDLTSALEANERFNRLSVEVNSFELIRSQLTPKGAIYTTIEEFKLMEEQI